MSKKDAEQGLVLLNPGSAPVVYNDDAQIIEPGKKLTIERVDETCKRAIDAGLLKLLDPATTQTGDETAEEETSEKSEEDSGSDGTKAKAPRSTARKSSTSRTRDAG